MSDTITTSIFENVFKSIPATGECDVDIEKVIKAWDANWSISQWKEEYRLVYRYEDGDLGKATISKLQAHELIGKLDLKDEDSLVFNSGRTWRN